MLYTGWKDKKNIEIYHKDIVINDSGRICVVEWVQSESFAGWDLTAVNSKGKPPYPLWKDLEVIGNVFENHELLKEVT